MACFENGHLTKNNACNLQTLSLSSARAHIILMKDIDF